jgi:hypothetical protein
MPKSDHARSPKRGASNAMKGLKKGCSFDLNGCSGTQNSKSVSNPADDPSVKSKTVLASSTISQRHHVAMTGKSGLG